MDVDTPLCLHYLTNSSVTENSYPVSQIKGRGLKTIVCYIFRKDIDSHSKHHNFDEKLPGISSHLPQLLMCSRSGMTRDLETSTATSNGVTLIVGQLSLEI